MTGSAFGPARLALFAAVLGALLVPLSYAWLLVRFLGGREPSWLLPLTLIAEVGAIAAGLTALALGAATARASTSAGAEQRRARIAAALGGGVLLGVVGANLLFIVLLPR